MKLRDAFERADEVVLHLGAEALETEGFCDRYDGCMDEGVPPEFDAHFDTTLGEERYFINSQVEVTLDDNGKVEVTVATAPHGELMQVELEFIQHVPLKPSEVGTMDHPMRWTATCRPSTANVINACRWLAEDIHSRRVAVLPLHVVAALTEAADRLQGSAPNPTDAGQS
jgi:hypothetical protein